MKKMDPGADYGQDRLFEDMKYENEEEDASLDSDIEQ